MRTRDTLRMGGAGLDSGLYERHADSEQPTCEWCGRSGELLALHVRVLGSDAAISQPVLCHICQGLLGITSPRQGAPFPSDREGQAAYLAVAADEARDHVMDLLRARYEEEGRRPPPWMATPPTAE
jgi:hypothetical protein